MINALILAAAVTLSSAQVAGTYYQGDGLGMNWRLALRKDGSFAFKWQGCVGVYDSKSGRWALEEGSVRLHVEKQQEDAMSPSIPLILQPIPWGSRMYLLDPNAIRDFADAINDGTEHRSEGHGLTLLRSEDWRIAVDGLPSIPASFSSLVLRAPIRGSVTRLLPNGRVRINRGAKHDVRVGLVFHYQGPDFIAYRVTSVSPTTAEAALVYPDSKARRGLVSTLLTDPTLQPVCKGDQ